MTGPVIEIVNFKLAVNVRKVAFLAEAPASTAFIEARPGFRARQRPPLVFR